MAQTAMVPPTHAGSSQGGSDFSVARSRVGAHSLVTSERWIDLDRRRQYYECSQHDWKQFDFDGRIVKAGPPTTQPFMSSEQASWYVPLKLRRPSSPVRIGKMIVDAFTNLVFGEERWPKLLCSGDADTQDFYETLAKESKMRSRFIQARSVGGAVGTVGLSWCYRNGSPRIEVHSGRNLFVHEWEDRELLIPAWVSEIYRYSKDEYDAEDRRYVRNWYWYRRDWTRNEEIAFLPARVFNSREPDWASLVNRENSVVHNDGVCHMVWVQNRPSDDVDGLPDYHGLYDSFDSLDMVNSVLVRGTTLNLDPTLVLKVDPDIARYANVKKGSDNSLTVGIEGDAHYMELAGSSVEAGVKLFELMRRHILEAAQCVIPDPNQIAASGASSVAMKVIYQPMLAQAAVLREQYGEAIRRLVRDMTTVARKRASEKTAIVDDTGETVGEVVYVVNLPPKVVSKPKLDPETNMPTGEQTVELVQRTPGAGVEVDLAWGAWFAATPQDLASTATTLQMAAGGKAFVSQQTAAEEAAVMFGRDPNEEWKRLSQALKADRKAEQEQMKMFDNGGDIGGGVEREDQLPFGAKPKPFSPKEVEEPENGEGEDSE